MARSGGERILILWNHVGVDEYEALAERGPQPLPWDPTQQVTEVATVQEEIDAIADAVRACGFRTRVVNVEEDLGRLLDAVRRFRPHAIFNLVEFFHDRSSHEAYVAGLFDLLEVPYTGAAPLSLMTCQRKGRAKWLLQAQGVPTPAFRRIGELPVPRDLGIEYPLIVKPAREDASGGVHVDSVVNDRRSLIAQVEKVLVDYRQPALVERYIAGREIHAAILGNDPPELLPLVELTFDATRHGDGGRPRILTYEAKWDPLSPDFYALDAQCPPKRMSRRLAERIRRAALDAYRVLECRDYARVDLRVDVDDRPYVLEVNPNPDLGEGVGFMLSAEQSGRSFQRTIGELIEMALRRGPERARGRRRTRRA